MWSHSNIIMDWMTISIIKYEIWNIIETESNE